MPYLGNQPADKYSSYSVQHFTTSATTSYTLDFPVANENEIALFINNVRQEPGSGYAYTASGTSLTLSAATSASDTMYCVFIGKAVQTVTPTLPIANFSSTGIDDNATSTAVTVDSSGNVGIKNTSPSHTLDISDTSTTAKTLRVGQSSGVSTADATMIISNGGTGNAMLRFDYEGTNTDRARIGITSSGQNLQFFTAGNNERMRIDSSGNVLVGRTDTNLNNDGFFVLSSGGVGIVRNGSAPVEINRKTNDGELISFRQDFTQEGTISVSGATVSYNGFTGTHWSRLSDNSKPTILKGTILESLDEMMDWYQVQFDITEADDEGNEITRTQKESYALGDGESVGDVITYTYEGTDYQATIIQEGDVKHTKSKVSNTVDAKNVYGVFMDWDNDDDTVNDMYVAQTGTFVVRINSAETVSKGDLIQSNGDGTGKVQADDIIRASTVAKVLSTTKIETYEDGSYIVPCSLHC